MRDQHTFTRRRCTELSLVPSFSIQNRTMLQQAIALTALASFSSTRDYENVLNALPCNANTRCRTHMKTLQTEQTA